MSRRSSRPGRAQRGISGAGLVSGRRARKTPTSPAPGADGHAGRSRSVRAKQEAQAPLDNIYVGVDVSKGYVDVCLLNRAGSILPGAARFDDTFEGHQALARSLFDTRLSHLQCHHSPVSFVVGLESSGGLERNWLHFFHELRLPVGRWGEQHEEIRVAALASPETCTLYQLNPLVVRRFLEQNIHRNITDAQSARGIAQYLRAGVRKADLCYQPRTDGALELYRITTGAIQRTSEAINQLQSLLPAAHPELVCRCQKGVSGCMLRLLSRYPTALRLSRARPETVAKISYLKDGDAGGLVDRAKKSVASLSGDNMDIAVRSVVKEITSRHQEIVALKDRLIEQVQDDPAFPLLTSIPGYGRWMAATLLVEVGSFERFYSSKALVAFVGLDPRIHQSGDSEKHQHITRHGSPRLRAALYMAAFAAIRHNPAIREFYYRLKARGKTHMQAMVACMGKMLRIAYACVIKGERFDPERYIQDRQHSLAPHADGPDQALHVPASAPQPGQPLAFGAVDAPVSGREARRRREALAQACPGHEAPRPPVSARSPG